MLTHILFYAILDNTVSTLLQEHRLEQRSGKEAWQKLQRAVRVQPGQQFPESIPLRHAHDVLPRALRPHRPRPHGQVHEAGQDIYEQSEWWQLLKYDPIAELFL